MTKEKETNGQADKRFCPLSPRTCQPQKCGWGVYDGYLMEWTCSATLIWYLADPQNRKIMEDERAVNHGKV
jgi:hypothetical protein